MQPNAPQLAAQVTSWLLTQPNCKRSSTDTMQTRSAVCSTLDQIWLEWQTHNSNRKEVASRIWGLCSHRPVALTMYLSRVRSWTRKATSRSQARAVYRAKCTSRPLARKLAKIGPVLLQHWRLRVTTSMVELVRIWSGSNRGLAQASSSPTATCRW